MRRITPTPVRHCILFDVDSGRVPEKRENAIVAVVSSRPMRDLLRYSLVADILCAENGAIVFKDGRETRSESMRDALGEDLYNIVVDRVLSAVMKTSVPKRTNGLFELRHSMINVCPIGRECSEEEEMEFASSKEIQTTMRLLRVHLGENFLFVPEDGISFNLHFRIWTKTRCLSFLEEKDILYEGNDPFLSRDKRVFCCDKMSRG